MPSGPIYNIRVAENGDNFALDTGFGVTQAAHPNEFEAVARRYISEVLGIPYEAFGVSIATGVL